MEEQLRKNQEDMEAMEKSWQEKMAEKEKEYQVCSLNNIKLFKLINNMIY